MITKCCWPQDGFRYIHMPPRNGPCQHPREGLLLMTGAFAPHQHTLLRWLPQSPWQLLFHSLPGRAHSSLEDTPAQVPQTKKGNLANSFPFWSFPLTTSKGSPWFLNATIWSQTHVTSPKENGLKDPRTETPVLLWVCSTPYTLTGQWTGCENGHIWSFLSTSCLLKTQRGGGMEVKWEGTL